MAKESGVMVQRFNVQEGQRYVQRSGPIYRPSIWKVGSIRSSSLPVPHALLVNVDDPLQTKTISCTTLADRIYYELIGDTAATAVAPAS
jgi:hypothetical protein